MKCERMRKYKNEYKSGRNLFNIKAHNFIPESPSYLSFALHSFVLTKQFSLVLCPDIRY